MKMRMAIATSALVVCAFSLASCAEKDPAPAEPTATAAPTTEAPTTPAVPAAAEDLVGDWQDTKAKWVVHFKDDGTYVEDFEGVTDFRVGKYTLADGVVSLIGDDGNTDKGNVEDQTLKFTLGALTRK